MCSFVVIRFSLNTEMVSHNAARLQHSMSSIVVVLSFSLILSCHRFAVCVSTENRKQLKCVLRKHKHVQLFAIGGL